MPDPLAGWPARGTPGGSSPPPAMADAEAQLLARLLETAASPADTLQPAAASAQTRAELHQQLNIQEEIVSAREAAR
eukprot:SAG22_NODE_6691_length_822_cov_1.240664_1_plen_77_part_00